MLKLMTRSCAGAAAAAGAVGAVAAAAARTHGKSSVSRMRIEKWTERFIIEPPSTPLDTPVERRIIPGVHIITTPRWRNWQTHYFEVVARQLVQVQILSWALSAEPFGATVEGLVRFPATRRHASFNIS